MVKYQQQEDRWEQVYQVKEFRPSPSAYWSTSLTEPWSSVSLTDEINISFKCTNVIILSVKLRELHGSVREVDQ